MILIFVCCVFFCVVDFQPIFVRRSFIDDQLGYRLHPKEIGTSIPLKTHGLLPQSVSAQHALLQDLQLGQPNRQPRPKTYLRQWKVGRLPGYTLHQHREAYSRYDLVFKKALWVCRLVGTSSHIQLVCLLWFHYQAHFASIRSIDSLGATSWGWVSRSSQRFAHSFRRSRFLQWTRLGKAQHR